MIFRLAGLRRPALFFLIIFLGLSGSARANHLLGGEIGYRFISSSGNIQSYRVTLKLLADCSTTSMDAFNALYNAGPLIKLYNGNSMIAAQTLTMNGPASDVDITPLCPDELGNNTCNNASSPYPGIKQFVYEGVFNIASTSSDLRFAFEGEVGNNSSAGRSNIIDNANVLNGSSIMYLYATLNNTVGANSSPTFTSVPTPFFCVGQEQNYNLAAVDNDMDSLTFNLSSAQQLTQVNVPPPSNIQYIAPYTATQPLPTNAGGFSFSSTNGQMIFTPNQSMNCVVVNTVSEYRNGVMVGSSMREMTFVILNNCSNQPPTDDVVEASLQNLDVVNENGVELYQVCFGQTTTASFDIVSQDPDNDNQTLTWTNLPPGATLSVTGNGTQNPVAHFTWNPSGVAIGNYTFYITYTDDGCPMASKQTIGYTVQVVPLQDSFLYGMVPACTGGASGSFWIQPQDNTGISYQYTWEDGNGTIVQDVTSSNGDTLSDVSFGDYSITVTNTDGCSKNFDISVTPPAYNVVISGDSVSCVGIPLLFDVLQSVDIATWTWDLGDGSPAIANEMEAAHSYSSIGSYTVTVYGFTDIGCPDTARHAVQIVAPPDIQISFRDVPAHGFCVGDSITLVGSGGISYTWTDALKNTFEGSGDTARVLLPGYINGFHVVGTDRFGCINEDSITVTADACCMVLFPNAFSPNADGVNDRFGPVSFGHPQHYQMRIHNRWGEEVFVSYKIEDQWDGSFKGKPAETGVYFYIVTSDCVDGSPLKEKGEVTLLR